MMQPQHKHRNQKLEAMRNKIKTNTPLITIKSHLNIAQKSSLDSPTTPCEEPVSSPFSGFKLEGGFSGFTNSMDTSQFFLKNAFQQKYQILEKLGEGANGVVRKCMNRQTKQIFAVKIGKMQEEHMIELQKIVHMTRKFEHQNILSIKQLYRDPKRCKYYHVMQYLPYPSLKQLMTQEYLFTPDKIKKIMKQLFSALAYFHRHYIVHRDIKTSNILFDTDKEHLYVIDLGIITKTVHRGKRRNLWSNNGTLEYKAPEMLLGSSYNESVDMWAAGVVLYELIEGKTPFKEESHFDIIDNITQMRYSFSQQVWKEIPLAKQLVTMLLKPKSQRLNAKQAGKAPWFQQIDWQQMIIGSESPKLKMLNSSSTPFSKSNFAYGSVLVMNEKKNEGQLQQHDDFQGLIICNPYNLRMSSYQLIDKDLNLSQILGKKQDKMIINNNG